MVKVKEDMSGWKMWEHGIPDSRLTVIKQVEDYVSPGGRHMDQWLCECSCEEHNKIIVIGRNIKHGGTLSCGCHRRERMSNQNKKYNKMVVNLMDDHGLYGIGYCSNTNREFFFDMDDYESIKNICWYESVGVDGYARLTGYIKDIKQYKTMAQFILGNYYDHKDRNTMNNRKYNLRHSTKFQNAQNHNRQKIIRLELLALDGIKTLTNGTLELVSKTKKYGLEFMKIKMMRLLLVLMQKQITMVSLRLKNTYLNNTKLISKGW